MRNAAIVKMKHFVTSLELRVLFDLADSAQIQHYTLLAFKDKILRADFNEFLFHILFGLVNLKILAGIKL